MDNREFALLLLIITVEASADCYGRCKCILSTETSTLTVNCTKASLGRIPHPILDNTKILIINEDQIPIIYKNSFNTYSAKSLHILSLQNNGITQLEEDAFLGLDELEKLYLSQNHIEVLGPNIFKGLPNVLTMSLSNNKVMSVDPAAFDDLRSLVRLRLVKNHIHVLNPDTFSKNIHLRELHLGENMLELSAQEPFLKSSSLEILNITMCQLYELPPLSFQGLPNLQYLDLTSNYLTEMHGIYNLSELSYLGVDDNDIQVLYEDSFKGLKNLKVLHLKGNRIQTIHLRTFLESPNIQILSLSNNDLTVLNKTALDPLKDLILLDLHANPFNCNCQLQTVYIWCLNRNVTARANCKHEDGSIVSWDYTINLLCIGEKSLYEINARSKPLPKRKPLPEFQEDTFYVTSAKMYILIGICIFIFVFIGVFINYVRRKYYDSSTPNAYDLSAASIAGGTYSHFHMGEVTSVTNFKDSKISVSNSLNTITPQSTLSTRHSRSPASTTERKLF